MNPNSGCNAAFNSQATACINKQLAMCGSDRKYILTRCPEGQECRALPLDNGSRGIYIQCISPSDAAAKLSPGQSLNISSTATASTPSAESATQKATVQGSSTTVAQGSVAPSSQTGKSSETSLSTVAASLPTIILPSATNPTSAFGPTTTKVESSSFSSLAVASQTPDNAGSPKSSGSISVSTTLLISTRPSKSPASTSESSTTPSAQTSASDLPNEPEPGISIIPEPRRTGNIATPTSSGILPPLVNAAADPVPTGNPFKAGSRITVRETVTVTTTMHDQR